MLRRRLTVWYTLIYCIVLILQIAYCILPPGDTRVRLSPAGACCSPGDGRQQGTAPESLLQRAVDNLPQGWLYFTLQCPHLAHTKFNISRWTFSFHTSIVRILIESAQFYESWLKVRGCNAMDAFNFRSVWLKGTLCKRMHPMMVSLKINGAI